MSSIANSALDLIGDTPLVRLNRLPAPGSALALVKVESLNPGGSIKDRIALAMVEMSGQPCASRRGWGRARSW